MSSNCRLTLEPQRQVKVVCLVCGAQNPPKFLLQSPGILPLPLPLPLPLYISSMGSFLGSFWTSSLTSSLRPSIPSACGQKRSWSSSCRFLLNSFASSASGSTTRPSPFSSLTTVPSKGLEAGATGLTNGEIPSPSCRDHKANQLGPSSTSRMPPTRKTHPGANSTVLLKPHPRQRQAFCGLESTASPAARWPEAGRTARTPTPLASPRGTDMARPSSSSPRGRRRRRPGPGTAPRLPALCRRPRELTTIRRHSSRRGKGSSSGQDWPTGLAKRISGSKPRLQTSLSPTPW